MANGENGQSGHKFKKIHEKKWAMDRMDTNSE